MAVKKKQVFAAGLAQVNTFVTEESAVSKYFNITDIPDELPLGKSSILIMGSKFLKEDVVLKMELIDNAGNAIYIEPVFDYTESNGVRVGIECYPDVAPGAATLTILAELDPEEVDFDIPLDARGVYNLKYSRAITVNTAIPNSRPIRFYKRPYLKARLKANLTKVFFSSYF